MSWRFAAVYLELAGAFVLAFFFVAALAALLLVTAAAMVAAALNGVDAGGRGAFN